MTGILDAGSVFLSLNLAFEVGSHGFEIANHKLEIGDFLRLFVGFEPFCPNGDFSSFQRTTPYYDYANARTTSATLAPRA